MHKRKLIIVAPIILALAALCFLCMPAMPARPLAVVRFVGYTNSASGERLASFTISNSSHFTIKRWPAYRIAVPRNSENPDLWPSLFISNGRSVNLSPGVVGTFLVPVPTNKETWRVRIDCSPYGPRQKLREWVYLAFPSEYVSKWCQGLPVQFVMSDWIRQ